MKNRAEGTTSVEQVVSATPDDKQRLRTGGWFKVCAICCVFAVLNSSQCSKLVLLA